MGDQGRCCLVCYTQTFTPICHECGYEDDSEAVPVEIPGDDVDEESNNCPDCFGILDPSDTICKDCGYDRTAVKKIIPVKKEFDLADFNMVESIEKRKAEAEQARQQVLVAARERYNLIRENEVVKSLEQSLNEQKENAIAKRKREEEETRIKSEAIKQQELEASNLLKDNIAKRKAEAAAKKTKRRR